LSRIPMVDSVLRVEHQDPQRAIEGMEGRLGKEGFKKAKALMGEPLGQKILSGLDPFLGRPRSMRPKAGLARQPRVREQDGS
ncbi:MAG: hypothetical protein QHH30_11445, partial [candidate division NC10 bacterium]|nr:hypothetical protein [candidate division NC10 bacterium]